MWLLTVDRKATLDFDAIRAKLASALEKSRFTARLETAIFRGYRRGIKIACVRLRNKKPYCGAHPGPCQALFPRKPRTGRWLEGNDWIGFNHLVNDVLDRASIECDVFSYNNESLEHKYYIRRGRRRAIRFCWETQSRFFGNGVALWVNGDEQEDFADYCGKPSPAIPELDDGTPGYACYTLKAEAKYRKIEAELGGEHVA